jgi:hypothetical protein
MTPRLPADPRIHPIKPAKEERATDTAFPTERLLVARFISALVSRPDDSLSVCQVARFNESHNSPHTIRGGVG